MISLIFRFSSFSSNVVSAALKRTEDGSGKKDWSLATHQNLKEFNGRIWKSHQFL